MKAMVYDNYGPPEVLHLAELEKPEPKDHEILIKIMATTVNYGDLLARKFNSVSTREFNMLALFWFLARIDFGFKKPRRKILGSQFAGIVESVGKEVKNFKVGDEVFGYPGQKMGTYVEYLCMSENDTVTAKPTNMTFEEAAVIPYGAIMALHLLQKADIQPGQKVLIIGAGGGIGSAAVQIASSHFGAKVTGVCGTPRLKFVKSLGAEKSIDYTKEDYIQSDEKYDLIFDILGKSSFAHCKDSLNENGRYLLASFKTKQLLQMLWTSRVGNKKVICTLAPGGVRDLISVKELAEAGKIKVIIDKRYPMHKTAEAHSDVENGRQKGHVVLTWDSGALNQTEVKNDQFK